MNKFWQNAILFAAILITIVAGYEQLQTHKNNVHLASGYVTKAQVSVSQIETTAALPKTINNTYRVYTRSDGTLMVNDKPFFPFGFYHQSQTSPDWTNTGMKRLTDLKNIAAAGFNVIHPEIGGNYRSDVTFLHEAQRLGVYILPNFSYDKRIEIVNKYKAQLAILGWDIADDVDHPNNKFTPDMIRKWHTEVKAADPNHITYISGAFPNRIIQFMNCADIVGFQSYPIDNDPNDKKPLRKSYYTILSVSEDEEGHPYNQPIIANLQAFAWKEQPPTFKEVRNMTYSALINGVKGIIYYSYFDNEWALSQQTDLWNGMKSLVPEINKLNPVLLEGTLTKLDTQVDDLFAGQWTHDSNVYIVVLSTSPTETINVSIPLPVKATGLAQTLFPERPSGMVFENGKLSGLINPGDVHVYQLSK